MTITVRRRLEKSGLWYVIYFNERRAYKLRHKPLADWIAGKYREKRDAEKQSDRKGSH